MYCGIRICASVALLLTLLCTTGTTAAAPASGPSVEVTCLLVRDKGLLERLFGSGPAAVAQPGVAGVRVVPKEKTCAAPEVPMASQALVGTGDLELVVKRDQYNEAVAWEQDATHGPLVLYVNGVALPNNALLVSVQHMEDGTHLRYQINQGLESQSVFSSLYRDKGLLGRDSLRVAYGWTGGGPGESYPLLATPGPKIGITNGLQTALACGVMALLLIGLLWSGATTDALRDTATPTWWRDAGMLRSELNEPGANRTQVLTAFEPTYDPNNEAQYIGMAAAALRGGTLPDHLQLIPIGLAIDKGGLKPVPASFSLARVQMAVWFAFAICAGLFLWIIYGQLRRIDGSLLALLAISVGTTSVSLGTDRNAGGRPYTPSKGFFTDLVTGFDDAQQVHRYQSVVVNLMLLFVGISHVLQQLTYPIFDNTWLALMGVSGATLGLGKQILEKPEEPSAAGSGHVGAPAPAPAPSSMGADSAANAVG